ncbi:MAG: nucleotidyltransferase domain-containing protein [Parcubacteria group bacterium]|jgi:predicted nucleotidyltransferase
MIEINKKKIEEIAKKHDLKLLLLFGSQASGKTHKFSDYDFGFLAEKEMSLGERASLTDDLMHLVGSKYVEDVDLKKAGPLLLKEIVKNNKILFQADFEYENFFSYAVRTYMEAKRIFDLNELIYKNTILKYKQKIHAQ